MKKILAIMLLTISINAPAQVTTWTDSNGTVNVYSSWPMPGSKRKTRIAYRELSNWQYVVAVPFYHYGNGINGDIMWARNYATENNIPFRDGVCVEFPYLQPCLR